MTTPALGEQELEVLRFISDRAPVTVGEVAREWGEPRNLARTTVLTMMERLRKKSFLERTPREKENNTFEYRPAVQKADLMRSLVADFVEKTLGGSLAPFMAYLTDAQSLSERERGELRRLVAAMESSEDTSPEGDNGK